MSKFFTFVQNNSGGSFDYDESRGISHFVIIEAENAEKANYRAEEIGLYFDGVRNEMDCPCCGDRWYEIYRNDDGYDEPKVYETAITKSYDGMMWMKNYEGFVHYGDGRVNGFWNKDV